jgi:hypothetical protein
VTGGTLEVGVDWSEQFHDFALGTLERGVVERSPSVTRQVASNA